MDNFDYETIQQLMKLNIESLHSHRPGNAPDNLLPAAGPAPLRNVYACLVHESQECVIDLVRNLRHLDQTSRILLYDGGQEESLLDPQLPWARWGVEIHPQPRRMKWGVLHGFAIDCLRYLKSSEPFDIMTVVDSDQLALRAGYTDFLAKSLGDRSGLGLLSKAPARQGRDTRVPPAITAQQELALWRPFLRRFPQGEDKFVHWTFWPSTVISAEAGFAMLEMFEKDAQLARILASSSLWATEEILLPTLTALLGFRVEKNPCAFDFVQYRKVFSNNDFQSALQRPEAFWMHPVQRRIDDPLRSHIRHFHGGYFRAHALGAAGGQTQVPQLLPMPRNIGGIPGNSTEQDAKTTISGIHNPGADKSAHQAIAEFGKPGYVLKLSYLKHRAIDGISDFVEDIVMANTHPKLIALFLPNSTLVTAVRRIYNDVPDKVRRICRVKDQRR